MTQCCHHLHESTNELVASHSRVSVFGFVWFCFVFRVFGLFRVPFLFALLMTMTAYWTMYRSFTSSLLWPSIVIVLNTNLQLLLLQCHLAC